MSTELSQASKDKLITDLKTVVTDAEELLRLTASQTGEKVVELRERVGVRLREAKLRLADAEVMAMDKAKAAARATDDFVHDQPWKAVGVAAALGLTLGVLIGRR